MTIHLGLLAIAGTATLFRMSGTSYAPSYTVDLVTLPPSPAAKPKTSKAAVKTPKAEAPKTSKLEKKPDVAARKEEIVKETPFVIEPAKSKVGDEAASTERRKRLEDLEKQAASLYESYRNEAVPSAGELPQAVVTAGRENGESENGARDAGVTGLAVAVGDGSSADIRLKPYYGRVSSRIRAAWVLPEGVAASEKDLLTVVRIRISTTGVIEDQRIEKGSGNIYYDQSILRAIRKASPLPPLPKGLDQKPLGVGLNFRFNE